MALGHNFLRENFRLMPNISFNIDNFGHSTVMASLFAEMGFNGNIIERLDDYMLDEYAKEHKLEFIWQPEFSIKNRN